MPLINFGWETHLSYRKQASWPVIEKTWFEMAVDREGRLREGSIKTYRDTTWEAESDEEPYDEQIQDLFDVVAYRAMSDITENFSCR